MKPATSIALIAAWIWIFQGCDTKGHRIRHSNEANFVAEHKSDLNQAKPANEHLAMSICNR